MKQFKANEYFNLKNGLFIFSPQDTTIEITIKAGSSKEIQDLSNKILGLLNADYFMKKALLEDTQKDYDMGIITDAEKVERENTILSKSY